jgi:subtilisin family serine protease
MRKICGSFVLSLIVAGVIGSGNVASTQNAPAAAARFLPDELLIEFQPWASEATKASARQLVGAALASRVRNASEGQLERVRLLSGIDVAAAIRLLRDSPAIRFAEPNWIYTHEAVSNDPGYTAGYLWGMYGDTTTPVNQFGSQAGEAWAAGAVGSQSVYVAVIDEGIDFNHPELNANIWTNPFDPPDGLDSDGNGFVDDVHGWDFFQHNNSIYDGGPGNTTLDSHGTHVSGTIGALGGNGVGVAGVNWNVTIISAKFLGPSGGSTADAVAALDYVTDLKQRHGLNIVATNNSWGGGGYSQALHDAILRAAKAGILFVAAAGNGNIFGIGQNNDTTPNYPSNYSTLVGTGTETAASYEAVIAVASITNTGARSSFSNYGATTVDLGAPGSGVWSTTPSNTYSSFSGTSMATPHVTGAAALYKSLHPLATAEELRTAILQSASATPTASLAGITQTGGRLNIGTWFATVSPPAAPSLLGATAVSASQINLSWTDNATNEDGVAVERCTGASCTNFAQIASLGPNATSYQNTGLAGSTTFRYRVRAFNGGGNSAYSNIAAATTQAPPAPPAAPSNLVATPGPGRVTLTWQDNSTNETSFSIFRCGPNSCTSGSEVGTVGANVTTFTDTNVVSGGLYRYAVRAANASGVSAFSNNVPATPQ